MIAGLMHRKRARSTDIMNHVIAVIIRRLTVLMVVGCISSVPAQLKQAIFIMNLMINYC